MASSAGSLAAAGGIYLFSQRFEANRADHDIVADHVAWGAAETERLGKFEALLQRRLYFRTRQIFFEPGHIETNVLGNRQRARLIGLAATAQQLLVKFEIFFAGLVLHADRHSDLRGLERAGTENREFLEDDLELWIVFHQREHVIHGALAVAAVVIEKFHKGDVAVRSAENDLARRAEYGLRVLLDRCLVLFGIRRTLPPLEFGHGVLNELWMRDQIFPDNAFDFTALTRGEFVCTRTLRQGSGQQGHAGGDDQV